MGLDCADPHPVWDGVGEAAADETAKRHGQVQEIVAGAMALSKPADEGPCMHVVTTSGHRFTLREGQKLFTSGGGGGGTGRADDDAKATQNREAREAAKRKGCTR